MYLGGGLTTATAAAAAGLLLVLLLIGPFDGFDIEKVENQPKCVAILEAANAP